MTRWLKTFTCKTTTWSQLCCAEKEIIQLSFSLFSIMNGAASRGRSFQSLPSLNGAARWFTASRMPNFSPFSGIDGPIWWQQLVCEPAEAAAAPSGFHSFFYLHRYSQSLFWKGTGEESVSSLKEQETRREKIMRSIAGGVFSVHSSG